MRTVCSLVLMVSLAGCGKDGERKSDGPDPSTSTPTTGSVSTTPVDQPPTLEVLFPNRSFWAASDTLTVRGTASDDREVTAVTVGGEPASSDDGFATWAATVSLPEGRSVLTVEVTDDGGQTTRAAEVPVLRVPAVETPFGGFWDEANNQLYYVDNVELQILRVDPDAADPALEVVASLDEMVPAGDDARRPLDLTKAGNRLIVACREDTATRSVGLWAFDLTSQQWSPVSTGGVGTGPLFSNPARIDANASGSHVFVLDTELLQLVQVDLLTGERMVLSSNTVPDAAAPLFVDPVDIAVHPDDSVVFVADNGTDTIFAADTAIGGRTVVTDPSFPGPTIGEFFTLAVDPSRGHLIYFDPPSNRTLATVSLATGERTFRSNNSSPPYTNDIRFLAVDGARLLWADRVHHSVGAFSQVDWTRELVLGNGFPSREGAFFAEDFALAGEELVLVAAGGVHTMGPDELLEPLAGPEVPTGPALTNASSVRLQDSGESVWLATSIPVEVWDIRLATGEATRVTGDVDIEAEELVTAQDVVEGAGGKLYLADSSYGTVFEVDIATGDRVRLSAAGEGGLAPLSPNGLAWDSVEQSLVVTDWATDRLVAVDPASGTLSEVTDGLVGPATFSYSSSAWALGDGSALAVLDEFLAQVDLTSGQRELRFVPPEVGSPSMDGLWRVRQFEGRTYVMDWAGQVFQVDLETGEAVSIFR